MEQETFFCDFFIRLWESFLSKSKESALPLLSKFLDDESLSNIFKSELICALTQKTGKFWDVSAFLSRQSIDRIGVFIFHLALDEEIPDEKLEKMYSIFIPGIVHLTEGLFEAEINTPRLEKMTLSFLKIHFLLKF